MITDYDIKFSDLEPNDGLLIMISDEQKKQFETGELTDMRQIKNLHLQKEATPVGMKFGSKASGVWNWLQIYLFIPEDVLQKGIAVQKLKKK